MARLHAAKNSQLQTTSVQHIHFNSVLLQGITAPHQCRQMELMCQKEPPQVLYKHNTDLTHSNEMNTLRCLVFAEETSKSLWKVHHHHASIDTFYWIQYP